MKTKFMVLICAAVMMASCGGNNQSSSTCTHDHGHDHADGKACCKEAGAKAVDMKKIISAQIFIKPEKVNDFMAATQALIEKSRAEAGCISYTLYQDPQDKTKFFFFEEWKNQAAVDAHFATEHFQNFGATLNECSSAPAVITIYDSAAEKKA